MKTLLEVLPAIAEKTEIRFASNFLWITMYAKNIELDRTTYVIHYYDGVETSYPYDRACVTKNLSKVVGFAREFGKDCQIFQITIDGNVNVL